MSVLDIPGVAVAQLCGVTVLAGAVQGIAGFGFTLLAISFFLLILGPVDAVQLLIIINLVISLTLAARLWDDVPRRLLGWMGVGTMAGFPLGWLIFIQASTAGIKLTVAVLIITFSAVLLWQRHVELAPDPRPEAFRPGAAVVAGVLSGALTMSLGMPGPVVALYLTSLRLGKVALRAASLTLLALCYVVALLLQELIVQVGPQVWILAALLLPFAVGGGVFGHRVAGVVSERVFRSTVLLLITATGGSLLIATLLE